MGYRHIVPVFGGGPIDLACRGGKFVVSIRVRPRAVRKRSLGRNTWVGTFLRLRNPRSGDVSSGFAGTCERGGRASLRCDAAILDQFRQDGQSERRRVAHVAEVRSNLARLYPIYR